MGTDWQQARPHGAAYPTAAPSLLPAPPLGPRRSDSGNVTVTVNMAPLGIAADSPESFTHGQPQQLKDAPKRRVEKAKVVDAYAIEPQEPTWSGTIVSVCVYLATIIYIVVLAVQFVRQAPTTTERSGWTLGDGPWPMTFTCVANSGCLVSNFATPASTQGTSDMMNQAQTSCFLMNQNDTVTTWIVFSLDAREGLSVMWDPNAGSAATSLPNAGILVHSELECKPYSRGCVNILKTPHPPGTALMQFVDTVNNTEAGAARERRQWFSSIIDQSSAVLSGSTPCTNGSFPAAANWAQLRLRMNSFLNDVTVDKDSLWLYLLGSVGGAYQLFLYVGFAIVLTWHFAYNRYANRGQAQTVLATHQGPVSAAQYK